MRNHIRVLSCILLLGLSAASGSRAAPAKAAASLPAFRADITRTTHGVVHVRAKDFKGIGYGLAYAYAQDNVCMFADALLTVRGERSAFFGGDAPATQRTGDEYGVASAFFNLKNEDSDFFFKGYLDLDELRAGYAHASQDARDLLNGYVAGHNRYLRDNAGHYPAACRNAKWVRPITVEDMYLMIADKAVHTSAEIFAHEILDGTREAGTGVDARGAANAELDPTFLNARVEQMYRRGIGSNALAIGRDLSRSGYGLLLANPHFPWTSMDRFYQAHLTVPRKYDAMGVIIGGLPVIVIGFNHDMAWTHTMTTAQHFAAFKLTLDPADATGTTYVIDGQRLKMTSKKVYVDVLMSDGSTVRHVRTFWSTPLGAVIANPRAGLNWTSTTAYVLADPNRDNTRMLDQWLSIGAATSVKAVRASVDSIVGLPFVNTIATDRAGNAWFADASVVPNLPAERFASDCLVPGPLPLFDGARSSCALVNAPNTPPGIFSPTQAPAMLRSDEVANSNDSYWLTNPRQPLLGPPPHGYSPLYGFASQEQRLRTRIGFLQLEDVVREKGKLQLSDLQDLMFVNRVHAAELTLPDLLPACKASVDPTVAQACGVLAAWDRRANLDSRGAVLFREFWRVAQGVPNLWRVPFDSHDPMHTPSGIASGAMPSMLAALKDVGANMKALNVPLDAKLGDYQGELRNGARVPLHGGLGDPDGTYSTLMMGPVLTAAGYGNVAYGDSYIQAVTFDAKGPVAQGMLVYGQSTDPNSPYYADQLTVYSRKEWPTLPFNAASVNANRVAKTTTLSE